MFTLSYLDVGILLKKKKQPVHIIPPQCGVAKAGRWRGKAGTLQIFKDQRLQLCRGEFMKLVFYIEESEGTTFVDKQSHQVSS